MSWQSTVVILLFPPFGAALWLLLSRGWALGIQGEVLSVTTRRRQKLGFWILIPLGYLLELGGWYAHHH
jgi:hypothetical protein